MHHENYTTNFTLLAVQLLILPKLNNEYIYIYTHIFECQSSPTLLEINA